MKILPAILLFIFCCFGKVLSQGNPNSVQLKNITPGGILLDKGWKYMPGDNPEWAKPSFDDGRWQPINPTLDVHTSLPQISTSRIGWFRLRFSIDSSVLQRELSFVIQQSGASEIYLNGIKIKSYGTLSEKPEKVKADDPIWKPLSISFNETAEQVIAVRYALQPNIYYTKIFETENPALTIKIMDSDKAVDYFHNNAAKIVGFSSVLFGICLMIIILHLSFYILYPSQKANLYFALFAVVYAAGNILQLIFWLYPHGVANKFYLGNLTFVLFIIGYIFLQISAYLFLERKRDFFFYFLIVYSGVAIILNAWPYGFGWQIGGQLLASQNETLEQQVQDRTAALNQSLEHLKATQNQLVQSEKMASLGELTAGIAHEIQNPLNFVNNFSEVSNELIDEMKAELAVDNKQEAIIIANDVKQNLEKILHHGKRADAIVKGMLQHSQSSTGKKELTNINALTNEYLRLSYHGFRAKDKAFNATIQTDFNNSTGNINIIPQDIGRVILNIITNAFYAVNEKQKQHPLNFEPTISVSTKKDGDKVLISVKDNGNGIQQKVLDKIFQPFFTTKPTGQGTGLGLSLAYDIIKAHGGEIKVETKEGKGTEFIIRLPIV